jgi:hypothetical protein
MDDRAGKVDKKLQETASPDKIWLFSGDLDFSLQPLLFRVHICGRDTIICNHNLISHQD